MFRFQWIAFVGTFETGFTSILNMGKSPWFPRHFPKHFTGLSPFFHGGNHHGKSGEDSSRDGMILSGFGKIDLPGLVNFHKKRTGKIHLIL